MGTKILQISDDFWNIRGSFKIAGFVDIGTQAALFRRANGRFVFLDSYTFDSAAQKQIDKITNNGADVEAVLNLHPFHTLHVEWMQQQYPDAKHFGTARHLSKFPDLNWQTLRTEDEELYPFYAEELEFSVPKGVDFISDDEKVHFSSVLVYHRESRSIYSDDTLMYIRLPALMRILGMSDSVSFHPTLSKVLEKRRGATHEFTAWAEKMAKQWKKAENLCAAHTASLLEEDNDGDSIHDRIIQALDKVKSTLDSHEKKYG
jgi:hypothetical protein